MQKIDRQMRATKNLKSSLLMATKKAKAEQSSTILVVLKTTWVIN